MKLSDGFNRWEYGIGALACYLACLLAINLAFSVVDLSWAYATWSGLGITMSVVAGKLIFHEAVGPLKLVSLGIILLGTICLSFT